MVKWTDKELEAEKISHEDIYVHPEETLMSEKKDLWNFMESRIKSRK